MTLAAPTYGANSIDFQTYKYVESNERMRVRASNFSMNKDFGTDWNLHLNMGVDAISGATPCWKPKAGYVNEYSTGECKVSDEARQSGGGVLTWRDAQRHEYRLSAAQSSEPDFVSRDFSAQAMVWQDEQHNRSYTLGLGLQDNTSVATEKTNNAVNLKSRSLNFQLGLNQVLNRSSTLELSIFAGRSTGYLSNHYLKIVRDDGSGQNTLTDDDRPALRQSAGLSARWIKAWSAPLKTHFLYRYYQDDWGVASHTIELKAYWDINERWRLNPVLRFYDQSRADFYRGYADGVNTFAASGPGSNDARLGAMHATTAQLHVQYRADKNWALNLGAITYRQNTGLRTHWLTGGFVFSY